MLFPGLGKRDPGVRVQGDLPREGQRGRRHPEEAAPARARIDRPPESVGHLDVENSPRRNPAGGFLFFLFFLSRTQARPLYVESLPGGIMIQALLMSAVLLALRQDDKSFNISH